MPDLEPVAGVEVEGRRSSAGSVVRFFALTHAATWACYITAVALSRNHPPAAPLGLGIQALVLLGTFSPSFVALALTARAEGEPWHCPDSVDSLPTLPESPVPSRKLPG